jgi:hypothetical protein
MTQERYQEAAEHYATRARRGRSFAERGASPHLGITEGDIAAVTKAAERDELAAEVLSKLASGWVLVPAKSTNEMNDAGDKLLDDTLEAAANVWDAMIAAAPKP